MNRQRLAHPPCSVFSRASESFRSILTDLRDQAAITLKEMFYRRPSIAYELIIQEHAPIVSSAHYKFTEPG